MDLLRISGPAILSPPTRGCPFTHGGGTGAVGSRITATFGQQLSVGPMLP
jgi:hypothetical protein